MALRSCFPLLLVLFPVCPTLAQDGPPDHPQVEISSSHPLRFGSNVLQVDFAAGDLDLPTGTIMAHVQAAASAVATYYGRLPVARARLLLVPVAGRSGIMQGTTWPGMNGFQGFTRIRIGQHTTTSELAEDWTTAHELVHMAFRPCRTTSTGWKKAWPPTSNP